MSDTVHAIPLDAIDAEAIARDRTRLDEAAFLELRDSIARTGLRQPIEVFALDTPEDAPGGAPRFGLVSGFRRLRAFRSLAAADPGRWATIPAFVRPHASVAEVLAAMVAENDVRADLSPWEKGAIAARATRAGHFPDIPEAIRALYPSANRPKRGRLRLIAELVDETDGLLADPERLSERECLRFAAAIAAGFADHIAEALDATRATGHEAQWAIIDSVLRESESFPDDHPIRDGRPNRRLVRRFWRAPRHRLTVRRERTKDGFVLHVAGLDATTPLVNEIFEEVERQFRPE
jgi:ParB family chromosome partitioning protein